MNSRKFFPKTLFGRSLVIILIPVLILQFVLIYFFYERHWEDVGRRLALALGGQISFIIDTLQENNFSESSLEEQFNKAEKNFAMFCVRGIKADRKKIQNHLDNSLMLVTALAPHIGYDNAAKIAKTALKNNTTLKTEALKTGLIKEKDYNRIVDPKKMISPN